jgi:hypothetical protein
MAYIVFTQMQIVFQTNVMSSKQEFKMQQRNITSFVFSTFITI